MKTLKGRFPKEVYVNWEIPNKEEAYLILNKDINEIEEHVESVAVYTFSGIKKLKVTRELK